MAVGIFEKPSGAMLSTCQNFGHKLYRCKDIHECGTRGDYSVVFCIDKQAKRELADYPIKKLKEWKTPEWGREEIYIFGKNSGMSMSHLIKEFKKPFYLLTIDAPVNTVFWVEPAMGIILYNHWRLS